MAREPIGASESFREYVFYTVRDRRITQIWSVFDAIAVGEQLTLPR